MDSFLALPELHACQGVNHWWAQNPAFIAFAVCLPVFLLHVFAGLGVECAERASIIVGSYVLLHASVGPH